MNKIYLACVTVVMLIVSPTTFAEKAMQLDVPANQQQFSVSLPANPTTGYQWSVTQYDQNLLSLTSTNYQPPKQQLIGAGGTMLFVFSLNKGMNYPKTTHLQFRYARSWEQEVGKMQEVEVHFKR